jgi:hypothetical protein
MMTMFRIARYRRLSTVMELGSGHRQRARRIVLLALGLLVVVSALSWGKIKEEAAYIMGMETYVYGYPLVVMDVTREVLTAAAAPNAAGTAAPINQLAKTPHYFSPYFTNVARISLNSLWTMGWLDLEKEPMVLSVPETRGRYYVFSVMNMWTYVDEASADYYLTETKDQPRALIGVDRAKVKVTTWRMPTENEPYSGIWAQRYYDAGTKIAQTASPATGAKLKVT